MLNKIVGAAAVACLVLLGAAAPAMAESDDYPYKDAQQGQSDPWGFTERQCVSFVAWRLHQAGQDDFDNDMTNNGKSGHWGDADNWDNTAQSLGYTVSSTPVVGSIAQWNSHESTSYTKGNVTYTTTASAAGHVALVTAVNSDGSVNVEQYNADKPRAYSTATVKAPRYLYIGVSKPATGPNPNIKLSQRNSHAVVTLTLATAPSSSGDSAYFFRRSGMTGKVVPIGTGTVNSQGIATRTFNATSGQVLALYAKDTGTQSPDSPYSNTISFKVN